jgi:DNA-directed RNA polymerase
VPPQDWTSLHNGGYLTFKDKLVNFGNSPITRDFQKDQDYRKLFPIINKLQQIPWRVNAKMLELIDYVYTNEIPVGNLPSSRVKTWEDYMTMPEYDEKDKKTWSDANKKRQQIQIDLDIEFSKRLMLLFNLGTAKNMVKYKKYYYSYQLDYRGRVYPTSTHLNLLGTSDVKSMIEFGDGQYLTADGVRWLKIHIANVYGLDKEPYDDRVAWVDDNYDDIMKVAKDALGNTNLWADADSPFEYAAACMAYDDHLSGEPVHLPIQLDATCSGIQMYSGLLLDEIGAKSVNVIGDSRNDIYQQVADGVEFKLSNSEYDKIVSYTDSEGKMHSVLTDACANSLRGNVSRKIVKRPTMTVPYSVTMRGMREQIDEELRILEDNGKKFWVGERWVADRLLTSLTSESIYSILDGAKKGQEYLVNLSRTLDGPAVWYSPIYDFPVHQNTIESNMKRINTVYGRLALKLEGTKHNKRRQANQIAPNFIHSIDSTILLGVIDGSEGGVGCIHDCFLVPPNDGYKVQEAYRSSYVKVMEADPLRRIQQQLDPEKLVEFPEYGDLDLNDVYDAQYIIS